MSSAPVLVERLGGVGLIRLNRPEALNALDLAAKTALFAALEDLAADPGVRCVVLTGTGRAFCVGQDLREHVDQLEQAGPEGVLATVPEHYNPIATLLHTMDEARGRRRQRGRRRRWCVVGVPRRLPAGGRRAPASTWPSRRSVCPVTPAAPGRCPGSSVRRPPCGCSTWAAPSRQRSRCGWASPPRSIPDAEFEARVLDVAGRLAVGPTQAYAAMRQAVAYASAQLAVRRAGVRG